MSATDQFPPRHLVSEQQEGSQDSQKGQSGKAGGERGVAGVDQKAKDAPLALPSPLDPRNDEQSRKLDVDGNKIALDELGPMVVNKDGTLSRIHNWAGMTDAERDRTLRVLGKRNQSRMADLRNE